MADEPRGGLDQCGAGGIPSRKELSCGCFSPTQILIPPPFFCFNTLTGRILDWDERSLETDRSGVIALLTGCISFVTFCSFVCLATHDILNDMCVVLT